MYEALRSYFVDGRPSEEVAKAFGYSVGSFRVMCHHFKRDSRKEFFISTRPGPRHQPKKNAAKARVIELRKKNHSVYEISLLLKEEKIALSPTAVRELLRAEGFSALPRRLDEERPSHPRVSTEAVANVRDFQLAPGKFTTQCGGLFLFLPDLIRLNLDRIAEKTKLPGSKMIPAQHALRAALALKLWSVERKSHIMSLVADPGLALFSGLNVIPKKSYLSEYTCRIPSKKVDQLLGCWHEHVMGEHLFDGESFNLDFHSAPYYGEDPIVENHYVPMRSRSQPSILVFLAQDASARVFCYSNADIRKGEESDEVLRFIAFWKKHHGGYPKHLVFDSKLTTYANLARLDQLGISFITLRRRSPKMLKEIDDLPPSAWRKVELDVPTRKFRTPRVFEQTVQLANCKLRQLYILDLGHDEPTVLLTNQHKTAQATLITRYAQRMLIENALSDAVRFFSMDALSSTVGMKVDFDMALLVIASALYRLVGRRMRGYADAQARQIFRDLIDIPADVTITGSEIRVDFHRRAHLPLILASDLIDQPVKVPWWNNQSLRLTTPSGRMTKIKHSVRSIMVRGNPG
jgi:transposase